MLGRQDHTGLHVLQGGFSFPTHVLQNDDRDQGEREGKRVRLRAGECQRLMAALQRLRRIA